MKKVDPTIRTIASEGDFAVIRDAAQLVDYLSIHHYEEQCRPFCRGAGGGGEVLEISGSGDCAIEESEA